MLRIDNYLMFGGNCEEAFNFYKLAFETDFVRFVRYKEMPTPNKTITKDEEQKIVHVSLPVGNNNLMGCDDLSILNKKTEFKGFSLSLNLDSKDNADKFFNALANGGKIIMPIGNVPWNAYFGMLNDKFGVHWMINFDIK